MKKFNPEKEIKMMKSKKRNNSSRLSNLFVPFLIVACSCMAMLAVSFSAYLENDQKSFYKVHIDIINGDDEVYEKRVFEGSFSDTITSVNTFGSISCSSGSLEYDPITQTISSSYLNTNTNCVIAFKKDVAKSISPSGLNNVSDNRGISYYYKSSDENNYVLLNDMIFRIVRINGDGGIRLILDSSIGEYQFGTSNSFLESDIKNILNDWLVENFYGASYLTLGDYDITNYITIDESNLVNLEGYYLDYVGLLSVREVNLVADLDNPGYLSSDSGIYLLNGNGRDNVYVFKDNNINSSSYSEVLSIRPVININATLNGAGTLNNPYTIQE